MKYLVSRDLFENRYLTLLLIAYLLAILFFACVNIFSEHLTWGLTPGQIRANIIGDEEQFIQAKSLEDLALSLHTQLFLAAVSLLTVSSILFRLTPNSRWLQVLTLSGFATGLIQGAGLVITMFMPVFGSHLKAYGFFGFSLIMIILTMRGLLALGAPLIRR